MNTSHANTELHNEIAPLKAIIKEQALTISKMAELIKYYESQLLALKRRQFGVSSEKTPPDIRQMTLYGEITAMEVPEPEPETEQIVYKRKKRKGKREEDLSGLPVERIEYKLPEEERNCPECGEVMADIGTDTRRELKLIPAKVVVVEHAAHSYACKNCQENSDSTPIVKAETPKPLISGSLASASLVAYIVAQKYSNCIPLYRIEKGFLYEGVVISRQTMANWVIKCATLYFFALYELLKRFLLLETLLHSDDTGHQILREPGRKPQTKSCEWVYRTSGYSNHAIVFFEYKETRSQVHPQAFLNDFEGYLHVDGYQAYHNLPEAITIVGCWQHARSYWEKMVKAMPESKRAGSDALRGFNYINSLFDLERKFNDLNSEERFRQRLERSKPIADAFFAWVEKLGALPKSPLGVASHYALSQRKYLENVFLDGRLELSNNRCERSVKSFVMGRKNWLFASSTEGAFASSIMYTLIETAKENGLNPFQYLKYLLEVLPSANTSDLESCLPWSNTLPDYCRVPVKS